MVRIEFGRRCDGNLGGVLTHARDGGAAAAGGLEGVAGLKMPSRIRGIRFLGSMPDA